MKKKILLLFLLTIVLSSFVYAASLRPYKVEGANTLSISNPAFMGGDEYTSGYIFDAYYDGVIMYNLKNNYRSVSLTIGLSDEANSNSNYVISFVVDGVTVKEVQLAGGDLPQELEIDLNYAKQMKIFPNKGSSKCVLADVVFN